MNFWNWSTLNSFRFQFKGILKPSYNSVDMAEVELLDQDDEPRRFNDVMLKVKLFCIEKKFWIVNITNFVPFQLRDEIMFQKNGSVMLHTKYHYDNMVGKFNFHFNHCYFENWLKQMSNFTEKSWKNVEKVRLRCHHKYAIHVGRQSTRIWSQWKLLRTRKWRSTSIRSQR